MTQAFERCDGLVSLAGLPFAAEVHKDAFLNCWALRRAALRRGYADVHDRRSGAFLLSAAIQWANDRREVPGRRYALLLCVDGARKQEGEAAPADPVEPLLGRVALLPDELVREIAELAFGGYERAEELGGWEERGEWGGGGPWE
jgi:hypothetical protein